MVDTMGIDALERIVATGGGGLVIIILGIMFWVVRRETKWRELQAQREAVWREAEAQRMAKARESDDNQISSAFALATQLSESLNRAVLRQTETLTNHETMAIERNIAVIESVRTLTESVTKAIAVGFLAENKLVQQVKDTMETNFSNIIETLNAMRKSIDRLATMDNVKDVKEDIRLMREQLDQVLEYVKKEQPKDEETS